MISSLSNVIVDDILFNSFKLSSISKFSWFISKLSFFRGHKLTNKKALLFNICIKKEVQLSSLPTNIKKYNKLSSIIFK